MWHHFLTNFQFKFTKLLTTTSDLLGFRVSIPRYDCHEDVIKDCVTVDEDFDLVVEFWAEMDTKLMKILKISDF